MCSVANFFPLLLASSLSVCAHARIAAMSHGAAAGVGVMRGGMHDREYDIELFASKQLELVELECAAEETATKEEQQSLTLKQLEEKGVVLSGLVVDERKHGLGGHTLLTLVRSKALGGEASKKDGEPLLPQHGFHSGDIVALRESGGSSSHKPDDAHGLRGLVYRVYDTKVVIAVDADSSDDVSDGPLRMFKVANDVTYKRYRKAMHTLREYTNGPAERVRAVLFGRATPYFRSIPEERRWQSTNRNLNEPQLQAIDFALAASDVALIHGPPGTGKTTTVVEFIVQCVKAGQKVLAIAPSNIAVDNLAERLDAAGLRIVRVGHPARVLTSVIDSTLDVQVQRSDSKMLANDARSDINKALKSLSKGPPKKGSGSEEFGKWKDQRSSLRRELGALRKEVRERENKAVEEIMAHAQVVLCTNAGAAHKDVSHAGVFDVCVIDEAAMALEVSCWIGILQAKKLVLAGDHCQLAPPIMSAAAASQGLGTTLFDRVLSLYGNECVRMLTVQYRMHQDISDWSSAAMYGGRLLSAEECRAHKLTDLTGAEETEETMAALCVVDSAGCDMGEEKDEAGSSLNHGEARVVEEYMRRLLDAGIRQQDIGILTPYSAQVGLLRAMLKNTYPDLEIGTVDGFQGREKEAILLCLVRSNPRREVGFLADDRRLNVAVTRARRHVALICDSETVSNHKFIAALLQHCQDRDVPFLCAHELVPPDSYSSGALAGLEGRSAGRGRRSAVEARGKGGKVFGKVGGAKGKGVGNLGGGGVETEKQQEERGEIEKRVEDFVAAYKSGEGEEMLTFNSSVSPFGRKVVHEISEKLALQHESLGEGEARFVCVCV